MSLFALDTDILSLFQRGDPKVCANVAAHSAQDIATTVITIEEQMSGWYTLVRQAKSPSDLAHAYAQLARTVRFLSGMGILAFDLASIQRVDTLRKLKIKIRKNDLRIAGIVLENGSTLVTRNARDFKQVPGLVFVDWSQ